MLYQIRALEVAEIGKVDVEEGLHSAVVRHWRDLRDVVQKI